MKEGTQKYYYKYLYGNLHSNENQTAKNNIVWTADITSVKLNPDREGKLFIFLCIDIHTNTIIAYKTSISTFTSRAIIETMSRAIKRIVGRLLQFFWYLIQIAVLNSQVSCIMILQLNIKIILSQVCLEKIPLQIIL